MKKRIMALLMSGLLALEIFLSPCESMTIFADERNEVTTEQIEVKKKTYESIGQEAFEEKDVVCELPEVADFEYNAESEYASTTAGYQYEGQDGAISWKVSNEGVLYLEGNGDYEGVYWEEERETVPEWSTEDVYKSIKKAVVKVTGITSLSNFFYNCQYMESVDLSGLDTSNVTNMATMFGECYSLKTVDLSNFNTSNVRYLTNLFYACYALESVDLSSFDTRKVVSIASMFFLCRSLKSVNLSSFDTSNVTDMAYMFASCSSLTEVDISQLEMGNVSETECMFNACNKLQEVNLGNHDLRKVENTIAMFQCCYSLKKADFTGTKLSSLTDTTCMFNHCEVLQSLDLSGFNTSKVKSMCYMFASCNELTELDVSNFNTSNVTDMDAMFMGCKLSDLDISMFDMSKCKKTTAMFKNCTSLETLNLPDSMTEIDARAFYNCINLKYLYTPQSIEAIGENAFYGCENTTIMCYPNTYVHTWAVDNGQKYQLIDHTHEYKETAIVNADCTGIGLFRGICTYDGCKAYYTKWKQGAHTDVTDKGKAATCTEAGLTDGSHCSVCNQVIVEQIIIPATGHTKVTDKAVEATCTKTGLTEGSHCSTCNKVFVEQETVAQKAHNYKETTTKAKIDKKGSIKTLCTECGKQKGKTTTINAIKSVKLSKTSYTYNGKEQKPSVTVKDSKGNKLKKNTDYKITYSEDSKNPGKYTVTVKFKGNYSGTKKLTYTIKPKAVSSVKVSAKSKGFKVTWKKGTKITGYQIQYSTSKKFEDEKTETKTITSSKTTSKTISKLKAKKKYYVRVRTYKTVKVDGKNVKIYSAWSDTKKVTTKK